MSSLKLNKTIKVKHCGLQICVHLKELNVKKNDVQSPGRTVLKLKGDIKQDQ